MTIDEKFRKTWRGWVRSSEGYAVRITGRTGIDYRDGHGRIRVDAEAMSSPWNEIVVHTRSVRDTSQRPKVQVVDRLRRAFDFAGWTFTPDEA